MSIKSVLYDTKYKESLIDLLLDVGVKEYDHGEEWVDYYKTYDFDSVDALYLFVNEDDTVVASGGYKTLPDGSAELVLFYTAKDYRHRGIARLIYQKCYHEVIAVKGLSKLLITTHREFSGYHMWLSHGFIEYNKDIDEFGNQRLFLVRYCI